MPISHPTTANMLKANDSKFKSLAFIFSLAKTLSGAYFNHGREGYKVMDIFGRRRVKDLCYLF